MSSADVRARLLSALGADLVGPFALGTSRADAHASAEVLPMAAASS